MRTQTIAKLLLILCIASACVEAKVYKVTWAFNPTPAVLKVKCGDIIQLRWAAGNTFPHNVAKAANGACPLSKAPVLKKTATSGYFNYKVKRTDRTFWLICSIGQHCSFGNEHQGDRQVLSIISAYSSGCR